MSAKLSPDQRRAQLARLRSVLLEAGLREVNPSGEAGAGYVVHDGLGLLEAVRMYKHRYQRRPEWFNLVGPTFILGPVA